MLFVNILIDNHNVNSCIQNNSQTMIFIADTKQGVLREKAGNNARMPLPGDYRVYDHYREDHDRWERHIASLKQYPLIGDGWEDGKEYQDSEIGIATDYLPGGETKQYARLKQPEESQEQMWDEIWLQLRKGIENGEGILQLRLKLSKAFTITRK